MSKPDRTGAPEELVEAGLRIFREWELRYPANDCSYAGEIDARNLIMQLIELVLCEKITDIQK
jgi:hypothetical protein